MGVLLSLRGSGFGLFLEPGGRPLLFPLGVRFEAVFSRRSGLVDCGPGSTEVPATGALVFGAPVAVLPSLVLFASMRFGLGPFLMPLSFRGFEALLPFGRPLFLFGKTTGSI